MPASLVVAARRIKRHVTELNLFEDETCRSDQFHLRTTIVSTRVYIVLLTAVIITLVTFTSLGTQSQIITTRNPSEKTYQDLLQKNVTALSCPCSRVAIPYKNFSNTIVDYHPVCSSVFVSDDWINRLTSPNIGHLYQGDFRASASYLFQLLAMFCTHANRSLHDALDDFHSETLLTPNVLLSHLFEVQVQAKSQFLQSSTKNSVARLLKLVRRTTHANRLLSTLQTSSILGTDPAPNSDVIHIAVGNTEFLFANSSRCLCSSTVHCSLPSGFFDNSYLQLNLYITAFLYVAPLTNLSGFVVGCSAVDSLLSSTLECLFDWSCLETIQKFIPSTNIVGIYALNSSQTHFDQNTSLETIINDLFIENWSTNQSFSNYFAQCAPILCTHTEEQRNNALYVLTKLIGFYGGLTVVLRLVVPMVIAWWRKKRVITLTESRPSRSYIQRLQTLWQSVRVKIMEWNLFKTPTMRTDPFELTTLRIATRIYLILYCLSIIIIILFTWLSTRTNYITDNNPSRTTFGELYKTYSSSLRCPCTQIAIPHKTFISLSPDFHPVCTSSFISDGWINAMTHAGWPDDMYLRTNIFILGHKYFVALATFCELVTRTTSDSLYIFNQTLFITDQTLSEAEFLNRANEIFIQFKSNIVAEFKHNLALIRSQTTTMYTTGYGDVYWRSTSSVNDGTPSSFLSIPGQIGNCSCALSDECKEPVVLYNYTNYQNFRPLGVLFGIPNMFVGCFSIQSLLQSTLECFFDQTCLDLVQNRMNDIVDVDAEDQNVSILQINSTRFPSNQTLQQIVNEMMIETWNEHIDYNQYYEECAPKLCSYFLTSRYNALYVFTTIVALIDGLSTALKIIVPLIVGWIRNRMRPRVETNNISGPSTLCQRVHALWCMLKKKILELNLFESETSWDDRRRRLDEIISTRIYLFLLLVSVIILIVYTAVTVQTQTITVEEPSQARFEQLVTNPQYSSTLDCPCQNVSIPYDSFISISFQYHQLCSSDFVIHNSLWIDLIDYTSDTVEYSYNDYRHLIVPHFRLLFYLCTLANNTFSNALSTFRSSMLVSKRAQSRLTVETQMHAAIDQFRSSTPKTFMRMLDFTRQMAHGNGLVSSVFSNWYIPPMEINGNYVPMKPQLYGASNCSCDINSMCTSSTTIDEWEVPGFLVGCYALESLLQSTLECLYDITCINRLKNINRSSATIIRPLNSTLSSPNVTVQSLINVLMVDLDRWKSSVIFEHYYTTCAAHSCTYVASERANIIYIITTIIGLFGGLSLIFEMIAPFLVKIWRYLFKYRQQRVQPAVAVVSDHEQINSSINE